MKVLFVGEGNHDIGPSGEVWGQPRPARGVVPVLARRVCPSIGAASIALPWREISERRDAHTPAHEADGAPSPATATFCCFALDDSASRPC